MSKKVEFFFDFGSPATYLAYTQLPKIAAARKAEIVWRPFLLGGVFKAINSASPVSIAPKGRWMFQDLGRWARRYGVPFEMNPGFPVNTLTLMRGAAGLQLKRPQDFPKYVAAMFDAMWVKPRNLNEPAEVGAVLKQAGFDAMEMLALTGEQEVKDRLKANTDEAVARGAFGAPTFFVGQEMFWGQDRLAFVDEALAA
ncbi:MAG: 2-hydroxychromene-2-carboxylate isomerase [Betaproteobacteria bacterium]|nr:2-hydroxychromene-2-carboxylate isomerase [Betaproteobacteria bacterium]